MPVSLTSGGRDHLLIDLPVVLYLQKWNVGWCYWCEKLHFDSLVQDYSNTTAEVLELQ